MIARLADTLTSPPAIAVASSIDQATLVPLGMVGGGIVLTGGVIWRVRSILSDVTQSISDLRHELQIQILELRNELNQVDRTVSSLDRRRHRPNTPQGEGG